MFITPKNYFHFAFSDNPPKPYRVLTTLMLKSKRWKRLQLQIEMHGKS